MPASDEPANEPKTLMDRIKKHPVPVAIVALFGALSGVALFLNQIPDLFDKTVPWFSKHVNIGGLSVSIQQVIAAVLVGASFFLFGVVIAQTRKTPGVARSGRDESAIEVDASNADRETSDLLVSLRDRIAALEAALEVERQRGVVSPPSTSQSRWLADPTDLTTFLMTTADLDAGADRAQAAATERLAPDAVIEFLMIEVAPLPGPVFATWSRMAGRHGWLYVREASVSATLKRGPYYLDAGEASWPAAARQPLPWRLDDGWRELVRQTGYRVRGRNVSALLTHFEGSDEYGWSTGWVIAITDAEQEQTERFSLKGGHLQPFEYNDSVGGPYAAQVADE